MKQLGIVGCGTIAAAIVEGLDRSGNAVPILVSPRNAAIAASLARRFGNVRVAATNQEVLDRSDTILLAVRPQIAAAVLGDLRFRADHYVLSVIATVTLAWLRDAVRPAETVVRAVPLPLVARCTGPTALFPPDPVARRLFDRLGSVIELADEAAFDVFTAATALMASHFAFAATAVAWMADQGVPHEAARAYIATMLQGLATSAVSDPDRSFLALADDYQTEGGINEQIRRLLSERGVFGEVGTALDAVLSRLRSAVPRSD